MYKRQDRHPTAQAFADALQSPGTAGYTVAHAGAAPVPKPIAWMSGNGGKVMFTALLAVALLEGVAILAGKRRDAATQANAVFDAALPDSAPMSREGSVGATGFGATKSNLSLAPDGSFFVYAMQRGDSSQLWYRSLVDASTRVIDGTNGGTAPRVSPDGKRVTFIMGDRTMIVPLAGGELSLIHI